MARMRRLAQSAEGSYVPMSCLNRFRRDETGSMTVEFVLWVPIIVALLVTMIDATTLYVTHSEMWNVARDTARRMVTGNLQSRAEAKAYAVNAMNLRDFPYDVDVTFDPAKTFEVMITLSVNDMSIIGYSPLTIFGVDMAARVIMRPDPTVDFGGAAEG